MGRIVVSMRAIARDIRKWAPAFRSVIGEGAASKLEKAASLLEEEKVVQTKSGVEKNVPAPRPSSANMVLVSVMLDELRGPLDETRNRRCDWERGLDRVWYDNSKGVWYVREQRYALSENWGASVLWYKPIPYDTLWEAFRSLDHQVDNELAERNWLISFRGIIRKMQDILGRETPPSAEETDGVKASIKSALLKLNRIRVENKRLARIVLVASKALLDLERDKQVSGMLNIVDDLFDKRIQEIEEIYKGLMEKRLGLLREESKKNNDYLKRRAVILLRCVKYKNFGLIEKVIDEDLLMNKGRRYMDEPNFRAFIGPMRLISDRLKRAAPGENDTAAMHRFFRLFWGNVIASLATERFMKEYRDDFTGLYGKLVNQADIVPERERSFEKIFAASTDRNVRRDPELYRAVFRRAAFVSPKTGNPVDRKPNPEFLTMSDDIIKRLNQSAGVREAGLSLLLSVAPAPETAAPAASAVSVAVADSVFFRDFADAKEATKCVLETIISILLRKKKLVLAFHGGLKGNESGRLKTLLNKLEALKENDQFKDVLKGLVVIPSFASAVDLNERLVLEGVDPKDTAHNAVFMFSETGGVDQSKVDPAVKSVFIMEEKGFSGSLYYYPLFEIVAITLIKDKQNYTVDQVRDAVKRLGIKFDEINIDINALTDKLGGPAGEEAFLVFSLIPNAERIRTGEQRERYARITEYIASAA